MKKKILVFAHDASLYGASKSLLTLLKELKNEFDFLVLLPYSGEMEQELRIENIPFQLISFPRCAALPSERGFIWQKIYTFYSHTKKAKPVLSKLISSFQPDLIYTNTSVISIGFELAEKHKIPHVWHIREYGTIDYSFNYFPSLRSTIQKIKKSSGVIFISKQLKNHWLGMDDKNAKVIYNGLAEQHNIPSKLNRSNASFTLCIAGAIHPGKGQKTALLSMARLAGDYPSLCLKMYGHVVDENYFKELKTIVDKENLQTKVHFLPFTKNIEELYHETDTLLCTSENEGFGRTIVEAMLRGIPVIANKSGGPLEIISSGEDGILYEYTEEKLSEAIVQLIKDPELYQKISLQGIEKAKRNFSVKEYSTKVAAYFNSVIISSKPAL